MIYTLNSPKLYGEVNAISSKSEAHRLLICAAFADSNTEIVCTDLNKDIIATAECLSSIGANIQKTKRGFNVSPVKNIPKYASIDCGESGSTLRFILPIIAILGIECDIHMHGRLPQRPLSPLYEILSENGVSLSEMGKNPLHIKGRFNPGNYSIQANISSQFISGLLFALSIVPGNSTLKLTGKIESAPYIDMTVSALLQFGADIAFDGSVYTVNGKPELISQKKLTVGADWSNAAFFLCAGALSDKGITVHGLSLTSVQGDKQILQKLEQFGASIEYSDNSLTVRRKDLHGIDIDASDIPDLVPILSVVAASCTGTTTIYNAQRLRLKESDRLMTVYEMINNLGGKAKITDDGLIIYGTKGLNGGVVDSYNDHRIAMSAAVASTICNGSVTISNFEAINKSYPRFTQDFESLIINKD